MLVLLVFSWSLFHTGIHASKYDLLLSCALNRITVYVFSFSCIAVWLPICVVCGRLYIPVVFKELYPERLMARLSGTYSIFMMAIFYNRGNVPSLCWALYMSVYGRVLGEELATVYA